MCRLPRGVSPNSPNPLLGLREKINDPWGWNPFSATLFEIRITHLGTQSQIGNFQKGFPHLMLPYLRMRLCYFQEKRVNDTCRGSGNDGCAAGWAG